MSPLSRARNSQTLSSASERVQTAAKLHFWEVGGGGSKVVTIMIITSPVSMGTGRGGGGETTSKLEIRFHINLSERNYRHRLPLKIEMTVTGYRRICVCWNHWWSLGLRGHLAFSMADNLCL